MVHAGRRQSRHHRERGHEPVLRAEHDLADRRQPVDALRLRSARAAPSARPLAPGRRPRPASGSCASRAGGLTARGRRRPRQRRPRLPVVARERVPGTCRDGGARDRGPGGRTQRRPGRPRPRPRGSCAAARPRSPAPRRWRPSGDSRAWCRWRPSSAGARARGSSRRPPPRRRAARCRPGPRSAPGCRRRDSGGWRRLHPRAPRAGSHRSSTPCVRAPGSWRRHCSPDVRSISPRGGDAVAGRLLLPSLVDSDPRVKGTLQ